MVRTNFHLEVPNVTDLRKISLPWGKCCDIVGLWLEELPQVRKESHGSILLILCQFLSTKTLPKTRLTHFQNPTFKIQTRTIPASQQSVQTLEAQRHQALRKYWPVCKDGAPECSRRCVCRGSAIPSAVAQYHL